MTETSPGFTLLELLLVLSVLLVLQCVAIPSFQHLLVENRIHLMISRVKTAVSLARTYAIQQQRIIRFCGSADQKRCDGRWARGQVITVAATGRVLQTYPRVLPGYRLIWRANFGRNGSLNFTPEGFTQGQQGTFYCCPSPHLLRYARGLVMLRSGRLRTLENSESLRTVCGNLAFNHDRV